MCERLFACCDVGQEVVDPLWGCGDFVIVDSKEEGYKFESSPLVPVDKRCRMTKL
jgi:hypothetical protein